VTKRTRGPSDNNTRFDCSSRAILYKVMTPIKRNAVPPPSLPRGSVRHRTSCRPGARPRATMAVCATDVLRLQLPSSVASCPATEHRALPRSYWRERRYETARRPWAPSRTSAAKAISLDEGTVVS